MQENPIKQSIEWVANKCYRSRPFMYEPVVIGEYLADISGVNLHLFSLKDFQLQHSLKVLSKQDQYCSKLRKLNQNFLVLFGMTRFYIVSVADKKIVDEYQLDSMLEVITTSQNYIAIIISHEDEEEQQRTVKVLNTWKVSEQGKICKKYEPFTVTFPDYEDCVDEVIEMRIILSIDNKSPRIYIYWRGTNQMIEVDPATKLLEKYSRTHAITDLQDIDQERYAQVQQSRIVINSKKGGKQLAHIINAGWVFSRVFFNPKIKDQIYTVSNMGLKMWKLQKNSTPVAYESADKYKIENIFFDGQDRLFGTNAQTNHILYWQKAEQCIIHHFPHEQIKRIMKINATQVCILLEAMTNREEEHEHHVSKYNKMEIYDLNKNIEIAKKGVLKFQYKIDIDSAIVSDKDTVRFILNQSNADNECKKYIFRWNPFVEDKKKQIKKREIVGAMSFDFIKLYSFDRIVTMTRSKENENSSSNTYSVFGTKNLVQPTTQIGLYDFSAKKFGDYDLKGRVSCVQMGSPSQLFVVCEEKLSVYSIDSASKNRLEKIHEIQVSISSLWPLKDFILIQRGSIFTVYDKEFQLVMKEDIAQYDEKDSFYKVLPINDMEFVLTTDKGNYLFDLDREETKELQHVPISEPNLTEILSGRIIVANKWIKAYPYRDSSSI